MANNFKFKVGDEVFGANNERIGRVEQLHGDGFHVNGQHYAGTDINRYDNGRIYLANNMTGNRATMATGTDRTRTDMRQTDGTIRVPVAEEQLDVSKRAVEQGSVDIHKRVVSEQVNVPVELNREEVRVERVNTTDRPLDARDMDNAFKEGTIRVPVRGEEAVVEKTAVVTGEVVVNKERTTERQNVSDTVRKEVVEVDENYRQHRDAFQQHFTERTGRTRAVGSTGTTGTTRTTGTTTGVTGTTGSTGRTRTFEDAEPNYQFGYNRGQRTDWRNRNWNDVEPDLRRDYDTTFANSGRRADPWEEIKEEVREGFERVRR